MTRVIYLSYIPLTAKVARDWYVDFLRESPEIHVEFWDVTRLLRGQVIEHYQQAATYVREFESFPELEVAIAEQSDAVFVLLLPKTWKFRKVFRVLSQHHCKTAIVKWGAMPVWGSISRASMLLWLLSPRALLSKIRNRIHAFILNRSWYVLPYELVFAAGQVMLSRPEASRRLVPVGLCDFEQYVQSRQCERLMEGKYAVFLDVYLPFHSDLALVGMRPLNAAPYYAELDRFFDEVERKYDLEVVIAAHPKARYLDGEFRGRKLIADKTAGLVKDAEFVICHASTSVSYAVLYRKPVWIIYTNEMEALYTQTYMRHVRALAAYLQVPLLNASQVDELALHEIERPKDDRYAAYEKDFLVTPGIEGGQSKEIFLREIVSLGN